MNLTGPNGSQPTADPSDEALAARVARRDVVAFTQLYDRYAQTLYAVTCHMVGAVDAEEVVQEIFLRLWRKAGQFEPARGSFKSWFMTLARNYMLDELKRRSRERRLVLAEKIDQLLATVPDPGEAPADEAQARERSRQILYALRTLPPEQRRAIILAYFGGFSQSAIAQQLDWPLGTVKKRIQLGLQKLRAVFWLQEAGVDPQDEAAVRGEE